MTVFRPHFYFRLHITSCTISTTFSSTNYYSYFSKTGRYSTTPYVVLLLLLFSRYYQRVIDLNFAFASDNLLARRRCWCFLKFSSFPIVAKALHPSVFSFLKFFQETSTWERVTRGALKTFDEVLMEFNQMAFSKLLKPIDFVRYPSPVNSFILPTKVREPRAR